MQSCSSQQSIADTSKPVRPIFLSNPDGTITEAIPPNYKDKNTKGVRNALNAMEDSDSSGHLFEGVIHTMWNEIDFLYTRHESVLTVLLLVGLSLDILYMAVYVARMRDGSAVLEFMAMYNWRATPRQAEKIYWAIFVFEVVYLCVFYGVALVALRDRRPKQYRMLANVGVCGLLAFVMLAYIDKFNLISFFLRLITYMYARFMQGLTATMIMLPSPPRDPNAEEASNRQSASDTS